MTSLIDSLTISDDDDDVMIIEDDDDENINECPNKVDKSSTFEVSDVCRNPWHHKWGNNDTNLRYTSNVPKTAQFTFQLLGYQPISRRNRKNGQTPKFCVTCISRATKLTLAEFKELEAQAKSNWKHETQGESSGETKTFTNLSRKQSENAQILAHLDKLNQLPISEEEKNKQVKQLRMLAFVNPGRFMDDFDPERSEREMKKMNRRLTKEKNLKKNQMYNEEGVLISSGKDMCDCLDIDCPGCHFPCPKCKSEKCGGECRCNRKWTYDYIESEGTGLTFSANP